MKLSTPLLATLACTQAICIEANADSQVDAEFIDFGGIGDLVSGVVNDIGDSFGGTFNDHWNDHIPILQACAEAAEAER